MKKGRGNSGFRVSHPRVREQFLMRIRQSGDPSIETSDSREVVEMKVCYHCT